MKNSSRDGFRDEARASGREVQQQVRARGSSNSSVQREAAARGPREEAAEIEKVRSSRGRIREKQQQR